MANSSDYLKNYGKITLDEMPFCAVDSFALCQSFYLPVEKVYRNLDPASVTLRELYMKAFEERGSRHKAVGVVLSRQISIRAVELARSARFGDLPVVDFTEVFTTSPAVQFAAMSLLMPDGDVVIVFRGTDDSIIGWKEDMDILVKRGMPSHKLAEDYVDRIAAAYPGKIIVCGHSKGGNLALWAAVKSDPAVRKRIRGIYNLEGPGFYNYHLYETPAYKELLDRYYHMIPHNAFIGVMLAHDNDYAVVRSSTPIGPIQHDLTTWMVQDNHPIYMPGLGMLGKINDAVMRKITEMIPSEYYGSIERVADRLVQGMGQIYLMGFVQNLVPSLKGTRQAWNELDEEMKQDFKTSFQGMTKVVPDAIKELHAEYVSAQKPAEAPAEVPAEALS